MPHPPRPHRPHRRPLRFEPLEDRRVLATLVVDTPQDVVDEMDGLTSLREAIATANDNPGADEIVFGPLFETPQTIAIDSQLPTISDGLVINGTGANLLTIDGGDGLDGVFATGDGWRLLDVDDGDSETLINVVIAGLAFTGGDTFKMGGAIRNLENLIISSSLLSGNSSDNGGGIYNNFNATLTIASSTFSGNLGFDGGGLFNYGTASIVGSTFSGNGAGSFGAGGGIFNGHSGIATVVASTVAKNYVGAGGGGAGLANAGVMSVSGSVIANTSAGGDISGIIDGSHNHIEDGSGGLSDSITGDPLLAPLADNGGPTPTHLLLPGSLAINRGDPNFDSSGMDGVPGTADDVVFDQRGAGFDRVKNGRIDIGAVESDFLPPEFPTELLVSNTEGGLNGDFSPDDLSLAEAIAIANLTPGGDEILFSSLFDTKQTIALQRQLPTITDDLTVHAPLAGLTIDGGNGADGVFGTGDGWRLFDINDGDDGHEISVALSGLSLTGGDRAAEDFSAGHGGAIHNQENLTLSTSTISGNAASSGGGLYNSGTATISGSTFSNNNARYYGGGLYNRGEMTITASTIAANMTYARGGGLSSRNSLTVTGSTISGNTSERNGGGMDIYDSATIVGSTVSGNSARFGGGISAFGDEFAITRSTIANNTATSGGGFRGARKAVILGSVIANNTGGDIVSVNDLRGSAFNFIADGSGGLSDTITGDARLGPLADNGGPTKTHALLPGSPALDAGDPNILPEPNEFDQRGPGFLRVANGDDVPEARIDIGAYESQGVPAGFPTGDYNQDGIADAMDYALWRETLGDSVTPGEGADGVADGVIDALDFDFWRDNYGNTTVPLESPAAPLASPARAMAFAGFALAGDATSDSYERELLDTARDEVASNDDELLLLAADRVVAPQRADEYRPSVRNDEATADESPIKTGGETDAASSADRAPLGADWDGFA